MAAAAATAALASARVMPRASWDTNPSPKPLVNTGTLKPPRPSKPPITEQTAAPTAVVEREELTPAQLLSSSRASAQKGKMDEQYLGYERWLPIAPKVKKPRSIYNAASLAYMGDCIYELYARRHFLYPPLSINEYNERVMKVVRCEAQDALLKKLLNEDYLTEDESCLDKHLECIRALLLGYAANKTGNGKFYKLKRYYFDDFQPQMWDVLRWGKNIGTSKTRTKKRAGVAVYNRASSLETLIGYLYLTDAKRLETLMYKLGFFTGASSEQIVEELCRCPEKQLATPVTSQTHKSLF